MSLFSGKRTIDPSTFFTGTVERVVVGSNGKRKKRGLRARPIKDLTINERDIWGSVIY